MVNEEKVKSPHTRIFSFYDETSVPKIYSRSHHINLLKNGKLSMGACEVGWRTLTNL